MNVPTGIPFVAAHSQEERRSLLMAAPFVAFISAGVAETARRYAGNIQYAAAKVGLSIDESHVQYAGAVSAVVVGLVTRRIVIGRWA